MADSISWRIAQLELSQFTHWLIKNKYSKTFKSGDLGPENTLIPPFPGYTIFLKKGHILQISFTEWRTFRIRTFRLRHFVVNIIISLFIIIFIHHHIYSSLHLFIILFLLCNFNYINYSYSIYFQLYCASTNRFSTKCPLYEMSIIQNVY